jgi:hypothetical protein
MKHLKTFESFLNEATVANQWDIQSHHIGMLQKGKVNKFTDGTSTPFSLITRLESGVSDTDKKLVEPFVDSDHLVIQFYPAEDPINNTMYDAVQAGGIKVIEDLIKSKYDMVLKNTLKGKKHCDRTGETCSVSHYLVFGK